MPAFYAWFNITASWDPYSNTKNIKIAVTNQDKWVTLYDKHIAVGDNLIQKLHTNTSLNWQFESSSEAEKHVRNGDYYASIVIPEDFSKNLMSFLSDSPVKPKLLYTVNEKINAIAPKITSKWVETLQEQIEAEFFGTLNEEIFWKSNEFGKKLQSYRDDITKVQWLIHDLTAHISQIHEALIKGEAVTAKGISALSKVQSELPELERILTKIVDTKAKIDLLDSSVNPFFKALPSEVISQMNIIKVLLADGVSILSTVNDVTEISREIFVPKFDKALNRLQKAHSINVFLGKIFSMLNSLSPHKIFTPIVTKNTALTKSIESYMAFITKSKNALIYWQWMTEDMLREGKRLETSIWNNFDTLEESVIPNIVSGIESIRDNIADILNWVNAEAENMLQSIPKITDFITRLSGALNTGDTILKTILGDWKDIENAIYKAQYFSDRMSPDRLDAILRIMLLDPNSEENFFRHPISIETKRLFPIPNYGSAIAPFFTILSIWVWALLAVSLLAVHPKIAFIYKKPISGYIGRMVLFLTIGIIQSLIVAFETKYILHVYISDFTQFVLVCMIVSILFQAIIYTLVYLVGNIGKVIAIILLLLQLSAWGGTFPVEMTNDFFQKVHPYLPFTYAINACRETIWGIVPEVFSRDILMLFMMIMFTIGIGLLLAGVLPKYARKFQERTESIDIFH